VIQKQPLSNTKNIPPPVSRQANGIIIISHFAVKHYFFFRETNRFSQGINDNIELFFRINGPSPDGYLNFQLKTDDTLPTDSDSYYNFDVHGGGQEMPAPAKINGIKDFDEAIMVLGLRNSGSSKTNIQIAYSIEEDDDKDESNFY